MGVPSRLPPFPGLLGAGMFMQRRLQEDDLGKQYPLSCE